MSIQHVGILSPGEMGLGIGKLLLAHGYHVSTFVNDRSTKTQRTAKAAGLELADSISQFVDRCDAVLSIVPPRDAFNTAKRVHEALSPVAEKPLFYFDLNAISPSTARSIDQLFSAQRQVVFIDGGIIGGVPFEADKARSFNSILDVKLAGDWHCPSLIVSGPQSCPDDEFTKLLNIDHLDLPIGAASGLKMCFAATTKGFYALAIQSFATAYTLGVMPELRNYLEKYNLATLNIAEKGLVSMPPKSYRWVHEMREIGKTMSEDGGFESEIFNGVSDVYQFVAEETELGHENPANRVRGKSVDDVLLLLHEGLQAKKEKVE